MDFRHQVAAPSGLAAIDVDALVVVIGERPDPALAAPLAAFVDKAVSDGDLLLKKGKALYAYQPAGVAARRVAVVVAGDDTPKAFKKTDPVQLRDLARYRAAKAPIVVIDAKTGKRALIWAELDSSAPDPANTTLLIHRPCWS